VIHDLAPVRVFRRGPYLELGITDRGFGYPMEVFARAAEAGWTVGEFDMEYRERIGESKVAGTVGGSMRATRALLRAAPRRRLR
jgi:dTDP-L-rhamnose 4-epimerase